MGLRVDLERNRFVFDGPFVTGEPMLPPRWYEDFLRAWADEQAASIAKPDNCRLTNQQKQS